MSKATETKIERLEAILSASIDLKKLRLEELGLDDDCIERLDDKEYRFYLKMMFDTFEEIARYNKVARAMINETKTDNE